MATQNKKLMWAGWVISGLVTLLMLFSASGKLSGSEELTKDFVEKHGYPATVLVPLAITELACVVLYVVPQTAVLGAILLTGYLGGAVATHVRAQENFAPAVIAGMLVWLALYLREPRLRALTPLRQVTPPVA
jgi:DoxX-like family